MKRKSSLSRSSPLRSGGALKRSKIKPVSSRRRAKHAEGAAVCKSFLESVVMPCELTPMLDEFDPLGWATFKVKHNHPNKRDPHHVFGRKNGHDPRLLVAALRPAHDYVTGLSVKAGKTTTDRRREATTRLGRLVSIFALEKGGRFDPEFASVKAGYDVCGVVAVSYAAGFYRWCPSVNLAADKFIQRWDHVIGKYGPRWPSS